MATRVNTRFVVILSLAIAGLAVLAAVAWFLVRKDASENVARARALYGEGRYKEAIEEMGKAIRKEPGNLRIAMEFVDMAENAEVENRRMATELLGHIRGQLEQAMTLEPENEQIFSRTMDLYYRLGRQLGDENAWGLMLERCQSALKRKPGWMLAQRYHGIAQVQRMRTLDIPPEAREEARTELEAVLTADPQDHLARWHLALWHILEARRLERSGLNPERAAQLRQQARQLADQMVAGGDADARRRLDRIEVYLELNEPGTVMGDLVALEGELLGRPEPLEVVLELAELLPAVDRTTVERPGSNFPTTRGLQRAQVLYERANEAYPGQVRVLLGLGQCLAQQVMLDEALALLKRIRELPLKAKPLEALRFNLLQINARVLMGDVLLAKCELEPDPAKRSEYFAQIEPLAKELAELLGSEDVAAVNALRGKAALVQGQWVQAIKYLDRASAQMRDSNPDLMFKSARARMMAGELGAAAERLRSLLVLFPDRTPVRLELARLQVQLRQYEEAQENLAKVLAQTPNDPQALQVQAALLAAVGKVEEAIQIMEKLEPLSRPAVAQALAGLYVMAGRPADARALLEQRLEREPKDLQALQTLMRLAENKEQAQGYLEKARAAGVNEEVLKVLASGLESPSEMIESLEELIAREPDAFRQAIQRFNLFRQTGKMQEALAALEQAAKINPDHPAVIQARFSVAIANRDWETASAMAARAAVLDLDQAQGQLFQGQLALVRGQLDQAIAALRKATSLRPVFSEGWRMLGEAYLRKGDLNEAINAYRTAVDQRPNNVAALRGLAEAYDRRGEYGQALNLLRAAVGFAPNDGELVNLYLGYEEQYGDAQKALEMRRKIDQAQPQNTANRRAMAVLLARLGQRQEAGRIMDELLKSEGPTTANLAAAASLRVIEGDALGAVEFLKKVVEGKGEAAQAEDWVLLARYLLATGQEEQALAAFQRAMAVEDPKLRPATRELADLLFERGLFGDAIGYYQGLYQASPEDRRIAQRYAEALLRAGKIEEGEQVLRKLGSEGGEDPITCVLWGLLARAKQDDEGALRQFRRAIELDPNRAFYHYYYAQQLASKPERLTQAVESLRRALELDRTLAPARLMLARIRLEQRDYEEAVRELQLALQVSPGYIPARLMLAEVYQGLGQTEALANLLRESAQLFPQDPVWPHLQARLAMQRNQTDQAQQLLEKSVSLRVSGAALADLAGLLLRKGQAAEALRLLEQHIQMVTAEPVLTALHAEALQRLGQGERARALFQQALRNCRNLGQISEVAGRIREVVGVAGAVESLEAVKVGSSQPVVFELVIAMLLTQDQQYEAALSRLGALEKELKAGTAERRVWQQILALAYQGTGRRAQARQVYEQLLGEDPDNVVLLNNLAYLLVEMDQSREALRYAERAMQLAPRQAQVLDTYGWALYKTGRSGEALEMLRRSLELGEMPANRYHLGEVLAAEGQVAEAIRELELAVKLAEEKKDTAIFQAASKRLAELKQ